MYYLQKYMLTIIGILMGAIAGFAYYYFVGCASGTCSITSSPINSTLYGALLGGLLFNMFQKDKKDISSPK
ncbi:MAG: hypothetical protein IPL21_19410 [Saprospirales bacterium]|nr:hypothetical protein [Saprospirales bacterium]